MSKKSHQRDDRNKKPGFLKSITSALDDVINEVKADVQAMTPPDQKQQGPRKTREQQETESKLVAMVQGSQGGLAETYVDTYANDAAAEDDAPAAKPEAHPANRQGSAQGGGAPNASGNNAGPPPKPVKASKPLPTGNLWHLLKVGEFSDRLHADICYHALTVTDVEQYLKAVSTQTTAPFTLGVLAINIPALTEDEIENGQAVGQDVLTSGLIMAMGMQARVYGAVGAGPRQLWPSLGMLDEGLTNLLNAQPKIIALGPLGIDEPFAPYTVNQQQAQLDLQLEIARDFDIPVLLTHRKSAARLADVLAARRDLPRLVFIEPITSDEDMELVKKFKMSAVLRPEVTHPDFGSKYEKYYRQVPEGKLLLASGSALVAPHGFSGHFNQPKFLANSIKAGGQMLIYSEHKLLAITNGNMADLFPQAATV